MPWWCIFPVLAALSFAWWLVEPYGGALACLWVVVTEIRKQIRQSSRGSGDG